MRTSGFDKGNRVSTDVTRRSRLEEALALADLAAMNGPNMNEPEIEAKSPVLQQWQVSLYPEALEAARRLDRDQLRGKYGDVLADAVLADTQRTPTSAPSAFAEYAREERAAKAKLGRALHASGVPVQRHCVKDYEHVIKVQLDLFQQGEVPSVSQVICAAYPQNPRKAKSLLGSTKKTSWKKAYNADSVKNHPVEIAMRATHGSAGTAQRCTAKTFGGSLGINAAQLRASNRITVLEERVRQLELQMQQTKTREHLDDAGATTSKQKVMQLYSQGKMPTEIAQLLGMKLDTVKSIVRRAKHVFPGAIAAGCSGCNAPSFSP